MSTVIDRPPNVGDSKPFWPLGRTRLVIDFTVQGDSASATAVDDQSKPAFTAEMTADQQTAFLDAVRIGNPGILIDPPGAASPSNDNTVPFGGGQTNHVIVTDPGPGPGPGPRDFYDVTLPIAMAAAKRPTGT